MVNILPNYGLFDTQVKHKQKMNNFFMCLYSDNVRKHCPFRAEHINYMVSGKDSGKATDS